MSKKRARSVASVLIFVLLVALTLSWTFSALAQSGDTSWRALLRDNPDLRSDTTVGPLERELLEALTPSQLEAWLDGADPETIRLADGRSLGAFLAAAISPLIGLEFHAIRSCTAVNTGSTSGPLSAGGSLDFDVTPETGDFSSQGGAALGCGVPPGAAAVLLNIKTLRMSGSPKGNVKVYAQGATPGTSVVNFEGDPWKQNNAVPVSLCTGVCTADLTVEMTGDPGATANLRLHVLGYYLPAADTLGDLSCALGEIAKFSAGSWSCASDLDTDTNTNAQTLCGTNEVLDGDGNCLPLVTLSNGETITNATDGSVAFTNNATGNAFDIDLNGTGYTSLRAEGALQLTHALGHVGSTAVNVGINTPDQFGGGGGVLALANATTTPSSAITDAALLYAAGGELFAYDSAGNSTQLSPHDVETGHWVFFSKNLKTGRVVRIDMEALVREVEALSGKKFLEEYVEPADEP